MINGHTTLGILDLAAFSTFDVSATRRELEKKGTRYLLKNLLKNEAFELAYSPQNKPYLKDSLNHISISHSHDKLAIIINAKESTGIDIELIRDKVINIRHKFLNERELQFAGEDTDRLVTMWAAKEALYKVHGLKELQFNKHLSVMPFYSADIIGSIMLNGKEKKFALRSEKVGNYRMVYVLKQHEEIL